MTTQNRNIMNPNLPYYGDVWNAFIKACEVPTIYYFMNEGQFPLPSLPENGLSFLLTDVLEVFKNEESMLHINGPIVVVGDLHGHLLDLFRIFNIYGKPSTTKYLFLGDIVDRGEFSLETITMILLAKILFPKNVFVIRGNHEFNQMGEQFGFLKEILEMYHSISIFNLFNRVFSYFPIAAVINKKYLSLHGGIGPTMFSLKQIEAVQRPVVNFDSQLESSILWSDPTLDINTFMASSRGIGYHFGQDSTESFLKETGMEAIIRGHECIASGVQTLFNNKVITVFSASDYCGVTGNFSGILEITIKGKIVPRISPPIPYLYRRNVKFTVVKRKIVSVSSSPQFDPKITPDGQFSQLPGVYTPKKTVYSREKPHIKLLKLRTKKSAPSSKLKNSSQIPKSKSFDEGLN